MNPIQHAELSTLVMERITDKNKVKQLISIALGIALANKMPLPTPDIAANTSGQQYFVDYIIGPLSGEISVFNENTVVSLDMAEEVARSFWLKRYYSAYPINPIPVVDAEDTHFLGLVLGTGHLIAPDIMEFCNQEATLIITVVNRILEK